MRYIFELNHPKHYYQFKYVMRILKERGHECLVLARDKDVLLNVLKEENVLYEIFGKHGKKMSEKILGTFSIIRNYKHIVARFKPDVIVSKASFYGCYTAKKCGCKSVIFLAPMMFVIPFSTMVDTEQNRICMTLQAAYW